MKIKLSNVIIYLFVMSLSVSHAFATTEYFSDGQLSIEIINYTDSFDNIYTADLPPSLINISTFFDDSNTTASIGDGYSDGVGTSYADTSLIELDTQASGYVDSAHSYAQSDAYAMANFEFENNSDIDYIVNFIVNYSLSGKASTDMNDGLQNGMALTNLEVYGDSALGDILFSSIEIGFGEYSVSESSISAGFMLGAGENENIYASLYSYGESDSLSAVPTPASAMFFVSSLMTLLVSNNKRKL